ncbi:MAG TPA: class II aldolase/adducin family protein [Candidatus Binatia bacterium]|jgi:ribulose-5-phosphate 4-epimerase/fuculose-1-phosphate aldolase|nr:class II aldolase/adducin family protein [Candidatus Binatia bacterium]
MASLSRPAVPAFDAAELDELKQKLVTACHILDREGITDGYGHVSARVPGAQAFVTIANVSPGCATVDRLIMMDFEGNYLAGADTPPNEWPIHACVFKVRPDVMSICHTHSVWSTLFSVLPVKLRPLHHYGKFLPADGPPVYEAAGLVRTVERGEALAAVLGDGPVALMRAHGDTVVGAGIEQAIQRTIRLAKLGELVHLAELHGNPRYLSAEELETFNADERFPARGWEYYVSRLGK